MGLLHEEGTIQDRIVFIMSRKTRDDIVDSLCRGSIFVEIRFFYYNLYIWCLL